MVSYILKLLGTKQNYFVLQYKWEMSFLNGRSLLREHYSKTEYCRIFIPMQIKIKEIKWTNPNKEFLLCPFHLSKQAKVQPVVSFIEIISSALGLFVRTWWGKLEPERKKIIFDKFRRKRGRIGACGILLSALTCYCYYDHIVETPITHRKKFVIISDKISESIGEAIMEKQLLQKFRNDILPTNHRYYRRARRVIERIISSNQNNPKIPDKDWGPIVIDKPSEANAISLPNGKILIFTGMLDLCSNDDQLAAVISHEMSHTILGHYPEGWSRTIAARCLLFPFTFIFWAIFKYYWAFALDVLIRSIVFVFVHLPCSRLTEEEADIVGCLIAARSCFDVREAPVLWRMVRMTHQRPARVPEWLASHPSEERRVENIMRIMPLALQLRAKSNCSALSHFETFYNGMRRRF